MFTYRVLEINNIVCSGDIGSVDPNTCNRLNHGRLAGESCFTGVNLLVSISELSN
jgi:hypothetical protein